MSPFKSKAFKDLKDDWYAVLKESGFEDIEQDENNLKRWDSHHFKAQTTPTTFEHTQEYYRLAGQFLHDHAFAGAWEKKVWELHASGLSAAGVFRALRRSGLKGGRDKVYQTIRQLAEIMVQECHSHE